MADGIQSFNDSPSRLDHLPRLQESLTAYRNFVEKRAAREYAAATIVLVDTARRQSGRSSSNDPFATQIALARGQKGLGALSIAFGAAVGAKGIVENDPHEFVTGLTVAVMGGTSMLRGERQLRAMPRWATLPQGVRSELDRSIEVYGHTLTHWVGSLPEDLRAQALDERPGHIELAVTDSGQELLDEFLPGGGMYRG